MKHCAVAAAIAAMSMQASAAVNDVFPADYVSLPTGTTTAAIYLFDRHAGVPYQQGRKAFAGSFDNQVSAVRVTQVMDVAGIKISPLAVLSWSRLDFSPPALRTALAPESSGFGDLRLGATTWLIDDAPAGHFLGFSGILNIPTGTYHPGQAVNIGENRYKFVLGGGWIHPLIARDLLFEISPEVAWYGDNERYLGNRRLAQSTSYALTTYLRYRITLPWQLHVGWQGNWGGRTHLDGIEQNNEAANQRWMAGVTWNANRNHQVILRWAQDYKIENGFKLDREVALRWLMMW